jgi:hypothetical protein
MSDKITARDKSKGKGQAQSSSRDDLVSLPFGLSGDEEPRVQMCGLIR